MHNTDSLKDFEAVINDNLAVIAYFSHNQCSVCKTLKPKLSEYFTENFSKIKQIYINIDEVPILAAQYSVFTVPVIVVFFEGKETYRRARTFGINELATLIERPYKVMFK